MWAAEVDSEEEEDVPSWKGERGKSSPVDREAEATVVQAPMRIQVSHEWRMWTNIPLSTSYPDCGRTASASTSVPYTLSVCIKRQWRKRLR